MNQIENNFHKAIFIYFILVRSNVIGDTLHNPIVIYVLLL